MFDYIEHFNDPSMHIRPDIQGQTFDASMLPSVHMAQNPGYTGSDGANGIGVRAALGGVVTVLL